jgi:hypothetical protein
MTVLLIKHRVASYDAWKKIFDEGAAGRKERGYESAVVYRDSTDPNLVVVLIKTDDIEAARAHTHSFSLIDGMARAGVTTAPEFLFLDEVEVQTYRG